jgi:hypothetical protein
MPPAPSLPAPLLLEAAPPPLPKVWSSPVALQAANPKTIAVPTAVAVQRIIT